MMNSVVILLLSVPAHSMVVQKVGSLKTVLKPQPNLPEGFTTTADGDGGEIDSISWGEYSGAPTDDSVGWQIGTNPFFGSQPASFDGPLRDAWAAAENYPEATLEVMRLHAVNSGAVGEKNALIRVLNKIMKDGVSEEMGGTATHVAAQVHSTAFPVTPSKFRELPEDNEAAWKVANQALNQLTHKGSLYRNSIVKQANRLTGGTPDEITRVLQDAMDADLDTPVRNLIRKSVKETIAKTGMTSLASAQYALDSSTLAASEAKWTEMPGGGDGGVGVTNSKGEFASREVEKIAEEDGFTDFLEEAVVDAV